MSNKKRPVNSRPDEYITPEMAFGGSSLSLPDFVEKDLKNRGLGYKWLNETLLTQNQGRHPRGWKVYKYTGEIGDSAGISPEGFLRSGDLILGVKPMTGPGVSVENHRKFLKQRITQQEASIRDKRKPFEDAARASGMRDYDEE